MDNQKDIFGDPVESEQVVALRKEIKALSLHLLKIETAVIRAAQNKLEKEQGQFADETAGMEIDEALAVLSE